MEAHDALRDMSERGHAVQRTRDHDGRSLRSLRNFRRTKGTKTKQIYSYKHDKLESIVIFDRVR